MITQLGPAALPGQRYGDFSGKSELVYEGSHRRRYRTYFAWSIVFAIIGLYDLIGGLPWQ